MVAEGEIAGDYLEELLDLLDFDGDIDLDVEGSRAIVSIDGSDDLNKLVGRKGEVLDALQELTRLAVHQKTGVRSRLMLDVASWRRRRRDELAALGDKVARRVLESGEREELAPMTPFERKIVHDAVAAVSGVRSESEGVGAVAPGRRPARLTPARSYTGVVRSSAPAGTDGRDVSRETCRSGQARRRHTYPHRLTSRRRSSGTGSASPSAMRSCWRTSASTGDSWDRTRSTGSGNAIY